MNDSDRIIAGYKARRDATKDRRLYLLADVLMLRACSMLGVPAKGVEIMDVGDKAYYQGKLKPSWWQLHPEFSKNLNFYHPDNWRKSP